MNAGGIYQEAIMALATSAIGHGTLSSPDGMASGDNPLCGDSVEMRVNVSRGRIIALSHQVKGCLLCRAAASVIGQLATGANLDDIERINAAVAKMLKKQAPPPAGWQELQAFAPVHAHRSRFHCVTLPFEALIAALHAAGDSC